MAEQEIKKDERYSYIDTKPGYSSCVLTGNWDSARDESQLPQSRMAIVPNVLLADNATDEVCERHLTTNQEDYALDEIERGDVSQDYIARQFDNYSNYVASRSGLKFIDDEKYNNNYMSLNRLVYDLWPKMIKEKYEIAARYTSNPADIAKQLYAWKPDRLDSFGNQTRPGRSMPTQRAQSTNSAQPTTKPAQPVQPVRKQPYCPAPTIYRRDFAPKFGERTKSLKMSDMIKYLG
ncbi:hypothetical protein KR222_000588 [Zaprionus bogoriensis]|nr:hypothetical protein KR222_000588 [Zaprionus bogoriensis]